MASYDYTDNQDPEAQVQAQARDQLRESAQASGRELLLKFDEFAMLARPFLDLAQQFQHLDEARKRIEWALGIARRAR